MKTNFNSTQYSYLRDNALYRKCVFCGKFLSDGELRYAKWYDPTCTTDIEPRDKLPIHLQCWEKKYATRL